MLDATAIQELQKTDLIKAANEVLPQTQVSITALHKDFNVTSLEKFMQGRQRFRGSFVTHSIDSFVDYASEWSAAYNGAKLETFIHADSMAASTIFDLGSLDMPGHCDHDAVLKCKMTAAYKAVRQTCPGKLSQMELSDFIEDWSSCIKVIDSEGQEMSQRVAVAAVRTITMQRLREIESVVGDFEASASALEKVEAKNKHLLPHYIKFTCSPYVGLAEKEFTIRVGVLTSRDQPTFTLRLIGSEEIDDQIVDEFKLLIESRMKAISSDVYVGVFSK